MFAISKKNFIFNNLIVIILNFLVVSQDWASPFEEYLQDKKSLQTAQDHTNFLKCALLFEERTFYSTEQPERFKPSITIVSPQISIRALENNDILAAIRLCILMGRRITVYTDADLDYDHRIRALSSNAEIGREVLLQAGVNLKVVRKLHSKNIIIDEWLMTCGSFNWLSAQTDRTAPYARLESSVVSKGRDLKTHISQFMEKLEQLTVIPSYNLQASSPNLDDLSLLLAVEYVSLCKFLYQQKVLTLDEVIKKNLTIYSSNPIERVTICRNIFFAINWYVKYRRNPIFSNTSKIILDKILASRESRMSILSVVANWKSHIPDNEIHYFIPHLHTMEEYLEVAEILLKPRHNISFRLINQLVNNYYDRNIDEGFRYFDQVPQRIEEMGFHDLAQKVKRMEDKFKEDCGWNRKPFVFTGCSDL